MKDIIMKKGVLVPGRLLNRINAYFAVGSTTDKHLQGIAVDIVHTQPRAIMNIYNYTMSWLLVCMSVCWRKWGARCPH